jgi:hypothetical protein
MNANQRMEVAQWIVNAEARRDAQGRIRIFKLKPADGGGRFEYAGINDRYHPEALREIRALVADGRHLEAERYAVNYIAAYTDDVKLWRLLPAMEAFLRDAAFNRGPKGALRILQLALGVADDGRWGPVTRGALEGAQEASAAVLLKKLRGARERYERRIAPPVGARAEFWPGVVNRWNNAERMARGYL